MADDLFGKYFLPKKEAAKPVTKAQPKPAYVKTAEMLGVSNADQKAKQVKAQTEQAAIAKRKYEASARTVAIKTAYGTFDVDHKGGLTRDKYAEYQAKLEKWAEGEGLPKKGVRADVSEPAPVPSELDFARDIVNKSELTKDVLDAFPARSLMKTVDPEGNVSQKIANFGKSIQVPNDPFIKEGPLSLAEFLLRQGINVPGQIGESYGTFINPKTDNVGVIQSGVEAYANAVPLIKSGKVGYAAWKLARDTGKSGAEALAKGVGTAVADSVGISQPEPKPSSFEEFRNGAKSGNAGDGAKPTVEGWKPIADAGYATNAVETPVTSFMAKEARRNRAVSFSNDLIAEIQKQKSKLRPKSSDYRRLDILEKEIAKGVKSGEFHPLVDDMLNEYDAKMGLSAPAKQPVAPKPLQPEPTAVQPSPTTQAIESNPKEVKPTDPVPVVLTPEQTRAQMAGTDPTSLQDAEAMANKLKTPTPETPGVTTSARKAQVADDRANMGLDPLDDPVRKTFGQSLDNARAKGYDEGWANREAEAVVAKPRALNDEETAGMVDVLAKLKNDHKALLKEAEMATDPADLTRINDQLMGVEKQFDNISTAVRKSGTEKGRALASQKLTINEDFDLISVRSRARANKGGELTPKEDAELVKRVNDLEAENASQATRITELTNDLVKALEVNTVKRRAGGFSRESTSAVRQQAATRFQEKVAKSSARASMLALNDATPEVIKAFREYVNAVVADGARGLDDVIKKMADDGVNADAEDIYTALTAKTGLRKLSDLQKELNDARKALKAETRNAVRPNWQQEAKAKAKATRESPEGVAKQVKRTKAQLESDIAKLDEQIKSGEYIEAQPKKVREVDAEVYKLRAIRKMKEDRIRAIQESVRPLSGAEKVGMVMTEMKMLNPFARMTDVAANTTNLASTAVETPARILVDKLVGAITKQDPLMKWNFETRDRLGRVMDRIKNSTGAEFQRTWTGTDKASMEKFGKSRGPGGKLAGSTDVPFRVIYREFGLDLFADLKARRTLGAKASKADIADMRESFLRRIDEHPDIIDAAEEYSLHKTFNNDNLVSKAFGQIRNNVIKNELGKVAFDETIARFSKVITNVGQDAFDRTPYGLVTQGLRLAIKRGNLTDVERLIITDKLAKGMVGSAFTALGYAVGDRLNVEFKGDKNKYVDFGDAEKLGGLPGSFLLGVARRQAEKLKPDQRDLFERQQVTNLLTNSPAASNVQDMLGALMQPGANKPEQFVAKKLTNMAIPSAIRDTARRMDSPNFGLTGGATRRETIPQEENPDTGRMRQTRNFWLILMKDAQSKIPVARQALPEKGDK